MAILHLYYAPTAFPRILPAYSTKVHQRHGFNGRSWFRDGKYALCNSQQKMVDRNQKYNVIMNHQAAASTVEYEVNSEIKDLVEQTKRLLSTMDDGRISVSAYDTAWIALIKDDKRSDCPRFPSAISWIAENQLPDGSWGDIFFCPYDRVLNTLACIVALRTWNIHPEKSQKGILFIRENVHKLENANAEHMPAGFEVIIPTLLQRAQKLEIDDLPYNASVITQICNARDQKMERIPKEAMHKVRTSLLYSLEAFEDLDWQKLLKLQSVDGSFLTCLSSTAFAFMETGDENCLRFITNTIQKFNGAAPGTYPVDTFARLWAVDRLQRLGISYYFESQIKDMMSYMARCWTKEGIFTSRHSEFPDMDSTSMGFRLLRFYGYDVDPSVFENFRYGDKFSCFGGQMLESTSPIYNLYRASQLQFPAEKILEEARDFAYSFLLEQLDRSVILDKWIICDHFDDEIRLGVEMPWYSTLPRVEARYYLEHYGGSEDVWIAKNLYRMEEISNDAYLELARLDFHRCQEQHQTEWRLMQEWYEHSWLQKFGIAKKDLLIAYFLSAASIFEAERSKERVAWAKSQIMCRVLKSFFREVASTESESEQDQKRLTSNMGNDGLKDVVLATLQQFLDEFTRHSSKQLKIVWGEWLTKLQQGEANFWEDAALLATTINITAGDESFEEDILSHPEYKTLSKLTNKICHQLSQIQNKKQKAASGEKLRRTKSSMITKEIEQDMQALVKLVLEESGGINRNIRETFLRVAKTYYYSAYNSAETIDIHMFKVLFEPVM